MQGLQGLARLRLCLMRQEFGPGEQKEWGL